MGRKPLRRLVLACVGTAVVVAACSNGSAQTASESAERALATPCGSAWRDLLIANEILFSVAFPESDTAVGFLKGPGTAFTDAEQATFLLETATETERRDFFRGLGFAFIDAYFAEYTVDDDAGPTGRRQVEGLPAELFERAIRIEDRAEDIVLLWDTWAEPTEIEAVARTRELLSRMDPVELVVLCDPQRALVGVESLLQGRAFDRWDLAGAQFDGSDLTRASFAGADLTGASFRDANLHVAFFTEADLTGADFEGADLTSVSFAGADLTDASLSGARNISEVLVWAGATCPDGTSADSHDETCEGHL